MAKNRVLIARGHVDATWRAGPCGSATRAHVSACAARRWHVALFIFTRMYRVIVHISLMIIENTLTPPILHALYKHDGILLFFCVGLSSTRSLMCRWRGPIAVRRIRRSAQHRSSIEWARSPPDLIKSTWLK